jgi:hypothetical protein
LPKEKNPEIWLPTLNSEHMKNIANVKLPLYFSRIKDANRRVAQSIISYFKYRFPICDGNSQWLEVAQCRRPQPAPQETRPQVNAECRSEPVVFLTSIFGKMRQPL